MTEIVIAPPRTVSLGTAKRYAPWAEVTAKSRLSLAVWQHEQESWIHFAAPVRGSAIAVDEVRSFDPGRRAAAAGPPPAGERDGRAPGDDELRAAAALLWSRWSAPLHRHLDLGVVSFLGESAGAFRRRCLTTLSPAIRDGRARGAEAADVLARLAARIESREITAADVAAGRLEARVAWYPDGDGPASAPEALLVTGEPGSRR